MSSLQTCRQQLRPAIPFLERLLHLPKPRILDLTPPAPPAMSSATLRKLLSAETGISNGDKQVDNQRIKVLCVAAERFQTGLNAFLRIMGEAHGNDGQARGSDDKSNIGE